MKYNPDIHHRKSIRLQGYDYSREGLYFITICTQRSLHLFGEIIDHKIALNDAGYMIDKWWQELKNKFPNIKLHEFIIMPNHIHGIIEIVGTDLYVCSTHQGEHAGSPLHYRIVGVDLRVCPDRDGEHIGSPLHYRNCRGRPACLP